MKFLVLLLCSMFFIYCSGDKEDSKQYTITHKATDVEDVIVFVNSKKIELSPGQCLILSENDFQNLRINVGVGGRSQTVGFNFFHHFTTIDLCGGSSVVCIPSNYDIVDKGTIFDFFQIVPTSFNKNCISQ